MIYEIAHKRALSETDYTLGIMLSDLWPHAFFVLEDEWREVKVPGETCIPPDRYQLKIRKEETPLTLKYRKRFTWFKYHIEITGIKDFKAVYVHIGNNDENTDGCPLLGLDASIDKPDGWIARSTQAFEMFYKKVYPLLDAGHEVYWHITE